MVRISMSMRISLLLLCGVWPIFGETEVTEVTGTEVTEVKLEKPQEAVVSSALMQASKAASPSFFDEESRKGLSEGVGLHLWEESESLLIEEFIEHSDSQEHLDTQEADETFKEKTEKIIDIDNIEDIEDIEDMDRTFPKSMRQGSAIGAMSIMSIVSPVWSGWSGWSLVLRSLLVAMFLHLAAKLVKRNKDSEDSETPVDGPKFSGPEVAPVASVGCNWLCSALHVAAADANLEDLRRLLHAEADENDVNAVDAWDETPLHMAVRRGSIAACELLLEAKANVNAENANDQTPLAVLSANGANGTRAASAKGDGAVGDRDDGGDGDDLVALAHLLLSKGAKFGTGPNSSNSSTSGRFSGRFSGHFAGLADTDVPMPCATALLESLLT